jgi:hypothetical protein
MRNFIRAAVAASLITLILCGCVRCRSTPAIRDGGTMKDANFHRLGKVVPGSNSDNPNHRNFVDPRPIVLWRGSEPAAILYLHSQSRAIGLSGEQRIERLDEEPGESWLGRHRGPFPLVFGSSWFDALKPIDGAESFDLGNIVTADVNGDGVDELIVPRANGAIGVYSIDKFLSEQPALHAPKGALYKVAKTNMVKLHGHDVVFFVLSLETLKDGPAADEAELAKAAPFVLWRLDQQGFSRLALPGIVEHRYARIDAIGAMNRPGSSGIDETLVVFNTGEGPDMAYLLRLRADGSAIEPPKEIYVSMNTGSLEFLFLPETAQAILADRSTQHLYFLQPDKASNWIADVDLKPLSGSTAKIEILHAMDPGTDPKVTVGVWPAERDAAEAEALYAINREGKCFRPEPGKDAWLPLPNLEPFLRIAYPSEAYGSVGLNPQPGADIILAMFSHEAKLKELSETEIMSAANRFLQPALVEKLRKTNLEFTPEKFKELFGYSDSKDERKAKGITEEITNAENWQRLLPNSYQNALERMRRDLKVDLRSELTCPIEVGYPILPQDHQNIEEYKLWLAGLKLEPDTTLEVIRHGQLEAAFHVPGYFEYSSQCEFRAGKTGLNIVLPLDTTPLPKDDKSHLGFYLAQFSGKAF